MSIENRQFSKQVRAGKRTYFFDIESNKLDGRKYFSITESKYLGDDKRERNQLKLYVDDVNSFVDALNETIEFYNKNVKYLDKVTNKIE